MLWGKCKTVPAGCTYNFFLVLCQVIIANIKAKSAYWDFNTSLLSYLNFKEF